MSDFVNNVPAVAFCFGKVPTSFNDTVGIKSLALW